MKKTILTDGGTADHVMPNIAPFPTLRKAGYEALHISSYEGMERELIEAAGTPYCDTSSGKLRRYFDWENFTDPFRALKGYGEAKAIFRNFRPDLVFSKGDYVAAPVVRAVERPGIPVVIHESGMAPGLANCLSYSAAAKICCNFLETLSLLPKDRAVLTGSPIRAELLSGSHKAVYERTGFTSERPVLLMIGGSLGSRVVNASVCEALPDLLKEFQVLRIAGKNNLDLTFSEAPGYRQFEYVSEELKDYFALANITVSRAGANAICEILALRKPNVLIPLLAKASHDDQIPNARSYEKQGYLHVLEEEALSRETLLAAVRKTYVGRVRYLAAMEAGGSTDGVTQVTFMLNSVTAGRR